MHEKATADILEKTKEVKKKKGSVHCKHINLSLPKLLAMLTLSGSFSFAQMQYHTTNSNGENLLHNFKFAVFFLAEKNYSFLRKNVLGSYRNIF